MRECFAMVVAAVLAGGCSSSQVALNERLFQLDTLAPLGAGCSLYDLGSGNGSGSGSSALGLVVNQRSDGDQVIVDVIAGDGSQVEKRYDAPFIASGQVDEFLVPATAGAVLMLKYWGAPEAGPSNGCVALDDPGPPGPYDATTPTGSATAAP